MPNFNHNTRNSIINAHQITRPRQSGGLR